MRPFVPEHEPKREEVNMSIYLDSSQRSYELKKVKLTSAMIIKAFFAKVKDNHKFFSIFNVYDPLRSRFNRMSLVFLALIGKMYFIGLFYNNEKQQSSSSIKDIVKKYSLNDMLIIFWSFLIMMSINTILMHLMKLKLVDPHMSREVFLGVLKYNNRKNIAVFLLFLGLFTYFCWSIAMFALHLDQFTSYKWILSTSVSFIISLILSPLAKVILINILLDYFIQKFKDYRRHKRQITHVVPGEQTTN